MRFKKITLVLIPSFLVASIILFVNNFFAVNLLFSFLGLLLIEYSRKYKSLKYLYVQIFYFFVFLISFVIGDSALKPSFILSHYIYIYSYIFFLEYFSLPNSKAVILKSNKVYILVLAMMISSILSFMSYIPSPHYPRISGFFINPNNAAFFIVLLFLSLKQNFLKVLISLLLILTGSFSGVVNFIVSLPLKRFVIYVSIIIGLGYTLYHYGNLFGIPNYAFVDKIDGIYQLSVAQDFKDIELIKSNTISARISHFQSSSSNLQDFSKYLEINDFYFREGILLSLISINPLAILPVILFTYDRIMRSSSYSKAQLFSFALPTLFFVPYIDPFAIVLFMYTVGIDKFFPREQLALENY